MTKISVLLPAYNAERFVGDTVRSVLAQTCTDFELIAIDDGSVDGTLNILKSFNDPRLRVFHQQNAGLASALNAAFRQASGDFLARIDADDICMPDRFSQQIHYLHAKPVIAVVGSAVEYIDGDGRYISRSFPPINIRFLNKQLAKGRCCVAHPTVMMRTEAFRSAGGYNEIIGCGIEDAVLWAKMISKGYLVGNIPTPLVQYRITKHAISNIGFDNYQEEIMKEIFANIDFLSNELAESFKCNFKKLQNIPTDRTEQRFMNVTSNLFYRLFCFLKYIRISEAYSERITFSLRSLIDGIRYR